MRLDPLAGPAPSASRVSARSSVPVSAGPEGRGWFALLRDFAWPDANGGRGALAVLSGAGLSELRRFGHRHVAGIWGPPESVRFVDASRLAWLAAADAPTLHEAWHARRPDYPVVLARHRRAVQEAEVTLRVPPDLSSLRGHFDRMPIVPGVIQIRWVLAQARSCLRLDGRAAGMDSVKFRRIVQPGHELDLSLLWQPRARCLRFELKSAAGPHSTGRLLLESGSA